MLFVGFHFWSSICFAKSRGKLFVLGMGPDGQRSSGFLLALA
jgi:hypothetical protein